MSDQYLNPDDEQEAAERRIEEIKRGGGGAPMPPSRSQPSEPPLSDDYETDAVMRARNRAQETRARLGMADEPERPDRPTRSQRRMVPAGGAASARSVQALMWIGGLVGAGLLLVLVIVLVARALGAGNIALPGIATATPTPTITPTLAPTRQVPELRLPPLSCIFQSGGSCRDYCQQPENLNECSNAKTFVESQGVRWDFWLNCVSPTTGPNTGNPQQCMRDGWIANNP